MRVSAYRNPTVRFARSCESNGKAGRLNVSGAMRDFLEEIFSARFVYEPNITFNDQLGHPIDTFLTSDRCFEVKW